MTPDERDAMAAQTGNYVSTGWNDGLAMWALWFISMALALVTGAVLLVAFLILGRSAWAALTGTILGVVAGAVLGPMLWFGADFVLSHLVKSWAGNRRAREACRAAFDWITYGLIVLPSAIVVATSALLS
jgi:hypothetical protein